MQRGGRNVKFHYYDRPFFSLHQKWLFSWSLLRHHYIQNGFSVDHYYNITTSKMAFQLITTTTSLHRKSLFSWSLLWHFRCSDFTYGIKKDHNVKNQKYLFKQLPMAYYLWLPRPVGPWGVRLGSIRLG